MASDHHQSLRASDANQSQMLRKRKRTSERVRVRVTRACDRCKKRKIKCNGTQPCEFCFRAKTNCTFYSSYARGRVPSIPSASDIGLGDNLITPSQSPSVSEQPHSAFPTTESTTNPTTGPLQHHPSIQSHNLSIPYLTPLDSTHVEASSQNSPEPSQTDLQGHYIGPASGVSFLIRVQKRLHEAISFSQPSSIFTFGDAPLHPPEFDPSFCMMLGREDGQRLVDRYFDFAMPTYRFLHRPTVQEWFEEFYDTLGIMRNSQSSPAKVALLFMVFAHARMYMPDNDKPGPPDLSYRYFLAAEHQLTKERGSIRLTSIQARLTQCFYLLTQSRINHCWSLFGTVSNLALAIGLNRNRRPDSTNGLSQIESECRRRTFWCAYTLDAYLSAALGRPRSFHDEDIDADLPACVEDHEIFTDHINTTTPSRGQSVMLAPLAHMKLARIISKILRDLYSIKPISATHRIIVTDQISKELFHWRSELASFLATDIFGSSLLIPIVQRQRNVLNLTYWHAIILTHRPFVLNNFTRFSKSNRNSRNGSSQTEESVRQCLVAAMNTVNTIDDVTRNGQMFRAFWITAYFAFTATIVLYIHVIQQRASPPSVYESYLAAATRCQSHISGIAEKGSLSERYGLVLEELRMEALRQTKQDPSMTILGEPECHAQENDLQTTPVPIQSQADDTNYAHPTSEVTTSFDDMPGSALSDDSGWGQFASMVSSGLGNLDAFLNDDSFAL